ncbi:hypothetical protein [Bacillus sp. FSL K6-3431]|uniref:hypothetical protein n=1 Tax=Bacillus sp. FSL K6-3431 TaxID=2921500 RepID=UPI0030F5942E
MNKELMLSLVDKVIKIDRGGPESRVGKVLAAEEDHLTVLTEDEGVIYYNTQHIKSLSDNAKQGLKFELEIPEDFEFVRAQDFKSVCDSLKYHWIKVNRGGPESLEGVLDDVNDDFMVVVSNEEIVRLSMFHVRNISYGVKVEKQEADKSENKSSNDDEKTANKSEESNKENTNKYQKDITIQNQ